MAYEFTRKKIRAERKYFVWRLAVAGLAACGGLAIGAAVNDLNTIAGLAATSVLTGFLGVFAFLATA